MDSTRNHWTYLCNKFTLTSLPNNKAMLFGFKTPNVKFLITLCTWLNVQIHQW